MSASTPPADLFPETAARDGVVHVNGHCGIRTRDGGRVVVVRGVPIALFATDGRIAYAMVQLVDQGMAQQREVARAFGCTARTGGRL